MNPYRLTASVTAIANMISSRLTVEETTFLASILVQLGDTLVTLATQKTICDEKINPQEKE